MTEVEAKFFERILKKHPGLDIVLVDFADPQVT
jgi:hypothetical protein